MPGPGAARRRGPLSWTVAVAALLLVAAGCPDLLGPTAEANPRMRWVTFTPGSGDGRILYLLGAPADTMFRLDPDRRIPVEITVSSGDRETARLYRYFCPAREYGPVYDCFQFNVRMKDGFDAAGLAGRVEAMGGRLILVWDLHTIGTGRWASVALFSPHDLVGRARDARSWPGVDSTGLSWEQGAIDGEQPPGWVRSWLKVPLRVDAGPAVSGDGIVQARSGDTVVATYRQPMASGGMLVDRWIVP